MEAILLVGGQGTRLRPLTIDTPKPMLPVGGRPVTEHQIARARAAGVERIVLGTSYRADVFTGWFGDGSRVGVELVYAVEETPLGTGGAIRNAAEQLRGGPDDPVLVFNGDILTGLDIAALVQRHRSADADVTLYLTRVADPRAYGLVPTDASGAVRAFLEKPTRDEDIVTDQINAGCYVFRRSVIDAIPAGRPVSVERDVFPALIESGRRVLGHVDEGYWLDLGRPLDFVRGSADLVLGAVDSPALPGSPGAALVLTGAHVAADAIVDGGSVVGEGAQVGRGARVSGSVLMDGCVVEDDAVVEASAVGRGARIGARAVLRGTVVGSRAVIGADNEVVHGARVWPDAVIAPGAIRFSPES
jgi:mannose-1-phosphate guanylyltransferase